MIDLLIEREGESELSEIRRPERIEVRRKKGQEEQSSGGRGYQKKGMWGVPGRLFVRKEIGE